MTNEQLNAIAVTPDRKTVVRFDVDDPSVAEPPFRMQRATARYCQGPQSARRHVRFVNGAGWQLEPFQVNESYRHERTEVQPATLLPSNGLLATPAYWNERPRSRRPVESPGYLSAWNGPNTVDSGQVFMEREVPAGQSPQSFTADQSVFPSAVQAPNYPLDRVAITTFPHDGQPTIVDVVVPGGMLSIYDWAHLVYFNGPYGSTPDFYGAGNYCLGFRGDGIAVLFEYGQNPTAPGVYTWKERTQFRYAPGGQVSGQRHRLEITQIPASPKARYGGLHFRVVTGDKADTPPSGIFGVWVQPDPPVTLTKTYLAPRAPTAPTPTAQQHPLRFEHRRDVTVPFQISVMVMPDSGYLIDDPFDLDFNASTKAELLLMWHSNVPSGCTLAGKLIDATTGADLEAGLGGSGPTWAYFKVPSAGARFFQARFDFTPAADDSTHLKTRTPTLQDYSVTRDMVIQVETFGKFTVTQPDDNLTSGGIVRVSLTGPESDPSHEAAELEIEDLTDSLSRLHFRSDMCVSLETTYDPADQTKTARLARLYLMDGPDQTRKGMPDRTYPSPNWTRYEAMFSGVWRRLSEAISTTVFDWQSPDPQAPDGPEGRPPFKATDAIKAMLGWCGFPPEMLTLIPDLETRLFSSGNNDLYIEPLADLSTYIQRIARDYLGMYLAFVPSVGAYGSWTVLDAPQPPYSNVARFVAKFEKPGILAHSLRSYQTDDVPTTFIEYPLRSKVKHPEGNVLVVTGTGRLPGTTPGLEKLTQVAHNFNSYNFLGLPSTDPHYPDPSHPDRMTRYVPIYVVDTALSCEDAVNFVLQRVFWLSCVAIKMLTVEAPLLLVDDGHGGKRQLMFYDPVEVVDENGNSTQWLVRNCNPYWTSDRKQWARYELQAPREPYV